MNISNLLTTRNFLMALRVWAPGDTTLSRTIGGGPNLTQLTLPNLNLTNLT